MLAYAADTQHEKIIRALALAVALVSRAPRAKPAHATRQASARHAPSQAGPRTPPSRTRQLAALELQLCSSCSDGRSGRHSDRHCQTDTATASLTRARCVWPPVCVCASHSSLRAQVEYGREDAADATISRLLHAQDDLLRYGGAYALALAYAGTSHNGAISHLLELAVSDVSDAVRRAAVTALGFVLADAPAQCPRVVALLSQVRAARRGAAPHVGREREARARPFRPTGAVLSSRAKRPLRPRRFGPRALAPASRFSAASSLACLAALPSLLSRPVA
jgi:hypothetical protein